jgi:predicted alpha-1,2-mannosidase
VTSLSWPPHFVIVAPAAQVPYGALRLGPDTTSSAVNIEFRHFSGYNYYDTMIRGFSHTRLAGAGVSDLGTFGIMPVQSMTNEELITGPSSWWSLFNKETETAKPGYYSVHLDLPNVDAEMVAASGFAGIHRYNYLSTDASGLAINMCHTAAIRPEDPRCRTASFHVLDSSPKSSSFSGSILIDGSLSHGIMVYLYGEVFSREGSLGSWTTCNNNLGDTACEANLLNSDTSTGTLYSYLSLGEDVSSLEVRVGISFISEDQAKLNLDEALERYDTTQASIFDSVNEAIASLWCTEMSAVEFSVEGETADRGDLLTKMYTAYYRSLMTPTIYSEAGGVYLGLDKMLHNVTADRFGKESTNGENPTALSMAYYSDLSLWDTFRTMLPWQLLVNEQVSTGILRSIEDMVATTDAFPRWPLASTESGCMIGMHGAATVVEGLQKGYEKYFNASGIQAAMLAQATVPGAPNGRTEVEFYLEHGYIPTEASDVAASVTLSYAFDDFLLAEISDLLGDTNTASEARVRSKNYEKIWSRERELMCTRSSAGELHCPIDPIGPQSWNMYKEGDAYHWLYFVPHDMEGLISLHRTKTDFLSSLEAFFQDHVASHEKWGSLLPNPYFWAGNEVCHHTVWFFNSLDCTRSQYWSRQILPMHFHATPFGLPGNDDYGAMSTFLLFTSLGFYPLAGTTKYFLGSPSVSSARISLKDLHGVEKGTLSVIAHDNQDTHVYVQKLLINGVEYRKAEIEHEFLLAQAQAAAGAITLEFFMSDVSVSSLCSA